MQEKIKVIAWLTRHNPTPEQLDYLQSKGYVVGKTDEFIFKDANHIVAIANELAEKNNGALEGIVLIAPTEMVADVLSITNTPIFRPEMNSVERNEGHARYEWSGKWIRTLKVEILTEYYSL